MRWAAGNRAGRRAHTPDQDRLDREVLRAFQEMTALTSPPDVPEYTRAEVATWIEVRLWRELGRDWPRDVVDRALDRALRRAKARGVIAPGSNRKLWRLTA